jgi:outer membrane protein assembly factor BamB
MSKWLRIPLLALVFSAVSISVLVAQQDTGWRVSPYDINIQVGEARRLQALDDSAQELHDVVWFVDDTSLADIQDDHGRALLTAKAPGTVRVSAVWGQETRYREIRIWPATQPLPPGMTKWGIRPIGREIRDLPAVPVGDGPNEFALEQTPGGKTYLRANDDDGIQVWAWLMPEDTRNVELVCGDWLGGAVISANRSDSYTLYAVGKDGKLRWQLASQGRRQGLAISTDHEVYLLSQSLDGTVADLKGLDEQSGEEKFDLLLPSSYETLDGLRKEESKLVCTPGTVSTPAPIVTTRVHVNMDGLPYIAFTQDVRELKAAGCIPGATVDPGQVQLSRDDRIVLWQIRPDGDYRSTVVDAMTGVHSLPAAAGAFSPTGAIMTDNMNGILLPVRRSPTLRFSGPGQGAQELVYRIDPQGNVVYKMPLPNYTGSEQDEMVIANNHLGFATRGGLLIAFDVTTGKELWLWDSHTSEISVFAALANGDCLVQTPTALVEVESSTSSKELAKGHFMIDWQGHMYRKHE